MALLLGVNRIVAARGVVSAVAACPQAVFISQPRFTPLQVRHKGRAPAFATDQKYFGWHGKDKEKNAKAETKKPATKKPAAKKPAAKKTAAKETAAKEIAAKEIAAKKTAAKEIAAKEAAAKEIAAKEAAAKEIAAKKTAAKEIAAKETAAKATAAKEVAEKAAGTQAVKKPFRFTKAKSRAKNAQSVFDKTGKEKYDFMRKDGAPILHLVDASDWIYRSFYAMPPFLKKHGTPTGAVIGFSSSLVTLISSLRPGDMIGLAFDAGKTWRNSEMPAYKTGRKSPPSLRLQIPECRRAAEALLGEQHCLSVPGMEADDIIAEIVKEHCPATPYTIAIHTRDQDFLQLVTENITVVRKFKGVYERVGPKEVDEHFGLPPEQLACYWALVGQAADSVSGVPGVGPKTAKGIIKALGNLESVFDPKHQDTLEEACGRRVALTLPEHEETCILGRRIMQLPSPHPPVPCWDGAKPTEQLAYAANNFAKGDQYLEYWGFNSLKKQYAKTQVLSA